MSGSISDFLFGPQNFYALYIFSLGQSIDLHFIVYSLKVYKADQDVINIYKKWPKASTCSANTLHMVDPFGWKPIGFKL